jgi:hypothetical protein
MRTRTAYITFVLAAALVLTVASLASGRVDRRPDLEVARVSSLPASVEPGGSFKVTATVRNSGALAAKSALRVYLSRDAAVGRGDLRVGGTPRVAALRNHGTSRVTATVQVPAGAGSRYRLVACADGAGKLRERSERNNCRPAAGPLDVVQSSPSSRPSPPPPDGGLANPGTPPPGGSPGTPQLTGRVVYTKRECASGPASLAPLANAAIKLIPASGQPVVERLDADGRFEADVPENESFTAVAVMDGPRIAVGADTTPYAPYEIPLGPVTESNQTFLIGAGPGNTLPDPASGAANIYTVLDQGARVAGAASPVALPKVKARWRYAAELTGWLGDRVPSQYDYATGDTLYVGGTLHQGLRDEWTSFALVHEYGHHVLANIANPPNAYGSHSFEKTYRDNPALPWSEGFANAFAAIVLDDPELTLGCSVRMDVSAKPAIARVDGIPSLTPMPLAAEKHLAQYNETAVAGSVWGVTGVLGSGDRVAGLGKLLRALKSFTAAYHAPEDIREVRDALTEFGTGQSTDLEQAIGDAFDDQRMRWGFGLEEVSQVKNGLGNGWVVPWTTGSFCDMPRPGTQAPVTRLTDAFFVGPIGKTPEGVYNHVATDVAVGPLAHTKHDECWETIRGVVLDANASVNYSLTQTLPFLAGQGHRQGRTILGVTFRCASGADICAGSSRTVTIRVGTGVWHRPNGQTYLDSVQPLNPGTVTVTVPAVTTTPSVADIVPVAEIDALGYCVTLVAPIQDCGS